MILIKKTLHPGQKRKKTMTELEFAAFLVSRVCHDLVGPLGAVVNGLEVLEDERDPAVQADALRIVAVSAEQALARLQFLRLAFGAAGSAGAELDLREVDRVIRGLLHGGRTNVKWQAPAVAWPKDWVKLLMNGVLIAADSLPRGGIVSIETAQGGRGFEIVATGQGARVSELTAKALAGTIEMAGFDARGIQQVLAEKLAKGLQARLTVGATDGSVRVSAKAQG